MPLASEEFGADPDDPKPEERLLARGIVPDMAPKHVWLAVFCTVVATAATVATAIEVADHAVTEWRKRYR